MRIWLYEFGCELCTAPNGVGTSVALWWYSRWLEDRMNSQEELRSANEAKWPIIEAIASAEITGDIKAYSSH